MLLPGLPARAVEFEPVTRLELLGGQFFFENEHTSFAGNGNWLLAPGVKFSERWALIPSVNGKYRRVREVQELIGGGFLTRETLENTAIVKAVYSPSEAWKIKPKFTYKNQMLVESADEKLGKGLFDNNKYGAGVELERQGRVFRSLRLSVDPYMVRFIRYRSLSSSSDFGSEINSGAATLDFNAYDLTLGGDVLLTPVTLMNVSLLGSLRPYPDQKKVTASGQYAAENRSDIYGQAVAGVTQRLPDALGGKLQSAAGVDLTYLFLDSDQNNYDASRTRFNENYYDYSELHAAPRWTARFMERLDVNLSYDYARRTYGSRPAQSTDGSYLQEKIAIQTHSISYSLRYRLFKRISLIGQGTYRTSSSNMAYEKTYRYNYTAQHYFLGFAWDY